MNPVIAIALINAARLLVEPSVREDIKDVNDAIDVLGRRFEAEGLIRKPDGSAWTGQDVLEKLGDLKDVNQEIRDLAKGAGD